MEKREVVIAGAGISGLTAAINLAKNGYKVKVYEKNPDCGMRFYGDFQGIENWSEKIDALDELKAMNLKINFRAKPFKHVIFQEEEGEKIDNRYKKPLFYLLRRGNFKNSLDQGLKKQALDLGVKIFFNKKIKESKTDIIATGPFKGKLIGFAKGIGFKTDFKDVAIGLINKKTSEKAYAYLLVDNKLGCICSCYALKPKDFNKKLDEAIKFFKEDYNIHLKSIHLVGGYSIFHLKRRYKTGKQLYAGESAGLQDYLFGFGMRYAFQSGFLAADSIINNYDYEKAAKKKFEKKMKVGIVNRLIWGEFEDTNYIIPALLFKLYKNRTGFFYKTYNGNFLRRALYPLVCFYLKKKYKIKK